VKTRGEARINTITTIAGGKILLFIYFDFAEQRFAPQDPQVKVVSTVKKYSVDHLLNELPFA